MRCSRLSMISIAVFILIQLFIASVYLTSWGTVIISNIYNKYNSSSFIIFDYSVREATLQSHDLPWWEGGSCASTSNALKNTDNVKDYCGYRSSLLGKGQKVLSYCLYGEFSKYATGLSSILNATAQLYPGWVVRLYTEPRIYRDDLCPLLENHSNFYICDVTNLPGNLTNITAVNPRLWRISVLGDKLVDVFLSRDIDAEILQREVDAVLEFMNKENVTIHIMRDHPRHGVPLLAGMFGVRQSDITRSTMDNIRTKILMMGQERRRSKNSDQDILAKYLLRPLLSSTLQHDSFTCHHFAGSVAFPTMRINGQFVGNRKYREKYRNDKVLQQCPRQCRPQEHQDWINC